jgi:uncharacterized protein
MTGKITHSEDGGGGSFWLEQEGRRLAEMTYRRLGESHVLVDHTYVDPQLRGQGVARQLLDAMVAWARQSNTKLSATCSYVVVQFARDATLRDVQATGPQQGSEDR